MNYNMGGRPKSKSSLGLTATARNRTNSHAVDPRHIVESLTRTGDFFIFPKNKISSVRRHAKYEGMKVRIDKHTGDSYRIERLYRYDDENIYEDNTDRQSSLEIHEQRIEEKLNDYKDLNKRLIGLMLEITSKIDNANWLARFEMAMWEHEQYLTKTNKTY